MCILSTIGFYQVGDILNILQKQIHLKELFRNVCMEQNYFSYWADVLRGSQAFCLSVEGKNYQPSENSQGTVGIISSPSESLYFLLKYDWTLNTFLSLHF